jgi:hypothetical protein
MLVNRPPKVTVGGVPTCLLGPDQTRISDKKCSAEETRS